MKSRTIRILVPIAIGVLAAIGFGFSTGFGNLSAIGWQDISFLCPLGAFTTMVASKALVPRALISLAVALALMAVFGRLFCGWICPVPVVNKIPQLFGKKGKGGKALSVRGHDCMSCREHAAEKLDSRHFVLLGAILSATVFGFPVFCLICPIGLSFATIFLVMTLFGAGDITWSLVVAPVLLLLEVTVFRKWCATFCPPGALMSLMGKVNSRTLRPTVDTGKCIEDGCKTCGRCSAVCEVGIDPRHPENGAGFNECLKCRECIESCPAHAITMPLLPKKADETPESESARA